MELTNLNETLTMTSREIAELTGKQPQHVKRDIEKMMIDLELDVSKFGRIYKDGMNRDQIEYVLPKDETICLVAGYSAKARMKIIKRWQELEQQVQHQIPQTYSQALLLAAQQAEKIEEQQKLIEQQKPAVEFVDRYVESHATKGIREVAKILGQKEKEFVAYLIERKVLFRQGRALLPYAHYQHCGYFEVKTGEKHGHAFHQTRFTPSGIAWIVKTMGL